MGSGIFLLSPLCFRRVNAFKGGFARFSICVWCIDVCTFRERNYNRAIRLRSALQQNLIAFTVMALASENYHWKRVEEDGGDRRGKEENKISERVYSVFRSTLENIIEYHRMFSNLLSYVSACVHAQKLFSPLPFSPCLHFYFSEYPRGNFITYIAKYFHELRGQIRSGMSVWNRKSHPRD